MEPGRLNHIVGVSATRKHRGIESRSGLCRPHLIHLRMEAAQVARIAQDVLGMQPVLEPIDVVAKVIETDLPQAVGKSSYDPIGVAATAPPEIQSLGAPRPMMDVRLPQYALD